MAAASCLILGILAVGWSFAMGAPPLAVASPEQQAALAADAETAHMEMEDPTPEQLAAREAAQARITEQIAQNEAAMARFEQRRWWLRMGGCGLAVIGIGLFLVSRGDGGQA